MPLSKARGDIPRRERSWSLLPTARSPFSGTQYSSAGGTVVADAKVGTYTLNPDCTGTLTLRIYDPSGTTLRRTSVWAIVIVDKATEIRGIMTSMVLPNGVTLSPIMTVTARKLFPFGH